MSCDYSVWHTASPLSSAEAGELHVRLCDGDASEVLPHPGIAAFYAELTAQHPEIDDIPRDQVGNTDLCPDGVGTSAWAGVVDHNPMDLSLYTSAAWTVLSSIQDGVSVTLREPWPLVMVGSEHQMAMPGAKVVDDVLELWYGDEDAPAIRFQPVKLRD